MNVKMLELQSKRLFDRSFESVSATITFLQSSKTAFWSFVRGEQDLFGIISVLCPVS